jgi:hypothetical protein
VVGGAPLLPIDGPLGIAGSVVITGVGIAVVWLLAEEARGRRAVRASAGGAG